LRENKEFKESSKALCCEPVTLAGNEVKKLQFANGTKEADVGGDKLKGARQSGDLGNRN